MSNNTPRVRPFEKALIALVLAVGAAEIYGAKKIGVPALAVVPAAGVALGVYSGLGVYSAKKLKPHTIS